MWRRNHAAQGHLCTWTFQMIRTNGDQLGSALHRRQIRGCDGVPRWPYSEVRARGPSNRQPVHRFSSTVAKRETRNTATLKKEVEVKARSFCVIWSRTLAFKGSFISFHCPRRLSSRSFYFVSITFLYHFSTPRSCYGNCSLTIRLFILFTFFLYSLKLSPGDPRKVKHACIMRWVTGYVSCFNAVAFHIESE